MPLNCTSKMVKILKNKTTNKLTLLNGEGAPDLKGNQKITTEYT